MASRNIQNMATNSPTSAPTLALVLEATRYVRLWSWRGKRAGLGMAPALPAICVAADQQILPPSAGAQ